MIKILGKHDHQRGDDPKYENVFMITTGKRNDPGSMAMLRRARRHDVPMLWQLVRRNSVVCFNTLADARAFCKQRGWL